MLTELELLAELELSLTCLGLQESLSLQRALEFLEFSEREYRGLLDNLLLSFDKSGSTRS